jgi:hypothetical protein
MFSQSPTFCAAWQLAAGIAFAEHRLLIRAQRLVEILKQLRTTRYRMGKHGLKVFCRLGCRTTLYRLGDILAIFIAASHKTPGSEPEQFLAAVEQVIFDGLLKKFGAEVHAKDLPAILGGTKSRDHALLKGALVPSIRRHRCVLFPLHALHLAVSSLAPQVGVSVPSHASAGRHK